MIRQLLYCLLFIISLSSCKSIIAEGNMIEICWPSDSCFNEKSKKFKVSSKEAYALLLGKIKTYPMRDISINSVFILGDEYFFRKKMKYVVPLKGFFINGRTLEIEYRESDIKIKPEMKKFPKDSFTKVEQIK